MHQFSLQVNLYFKLKYNDILNYYPIFNLIPHLYLFVINQENQLIKNCWLLFGEKANINLIVELFYFNDIYLLIV